MVRIQSPSNGNPNTTAGRQPKPYRHSPDPVRHREQVDPIKHREFKPTEFKATNQPYEYKPYKPSHVGIYGEKQKERKPRPKPPTPKATKKIQKPKETFDCYSDPKGPDIKTGDIGPEYPTSTYEYQEYKPNIQPHNNDSDYDPIKAKPSYIDRPTEVYKGDVTYKLDENNNAAMRHWQYGFVNDTVAAKGSSTKPEHKYTVKEKPKPKTETQKPVESKPKPKTPEKTKPEKKPEPKPAVVAVVPVHKATKPATPPPPKKTFTSSSTQHIAPGVKTGTTQTQDNTKTTTSSTQYESQKMKTMSIQTDMPSAPIPVIAPVPLPKKPVQTRSEGIQCSEAPKNVTVRGTQSDRTAMRGMDTQTSPVMFTTMQPQQSNKTRIRSPEVVKQETLVYRSAPRRTPSPQIVPVVVAAPYRQPDSPVRRSSRQDSPKVQRSSSKPKPAPEKIKTPPPVHPVPDSRWTPSPEVVETAPVYAFAKPPSKYKPDSPKQSSIQQTPKNDTILPRVRETEQSPKVFIPGTSKPVQHSSTLPTVAKQPSPINSGLGLFPYQSTKSRLPPEVTACIEAYDCAHGPAIYK